MFLHETAENQQSICTEHNITMAMCRIKLNFKNVKVIVNLAFHFSLLMNFILTKYLIIMA